MRNKTIIFFVLWMILLAISQSAAAALVGKVTAIWLDTEGSRLMFKIDDSNSATVCPPGSEFYGFNLYISTSNKNFPYYYGLITTSMTKSIPLYLVIGGTNSGPCDVLSGSYGIVLTE